MTVGEVNLLGAKVQDSHRFKLEGPLEHHRSGSILEVNVEAHVEDTPSRLRHLERSLSHFHDAGLERRVEVKCHAPYLWAVGAVEGFDEGHPLVPAVEEEMMDGGCCGLF